MNLWSSLSSSRAIARGGPFCDGLGPPGDDRRKTRAPAPPPGDVERFVLAYAREEIGDGPAAAFLMAALLNGLDDGETLAMTRAMIASAKR